MNTLTKDVTSTFFKDAAGFSLLNKVATRIGTDRLEISPAQFLVLNAIRGRDWTKSFTIMTNQSKIDNGNLVNSRLLKALTEVQRLAYFADTSSPTHDEKKALTDFLSPFEGIVTAKGLVELANHLPAINACIQTVPVLKKDGSVKKERIVSVNKPEAFLDIVAVAA